MQHWLRGMDASGQECNGLGNSCHTRPTARGVSSRRRRRTLVLLHTMELSPMRVCRLSRQEELRTVLAVVDLVPRMLGILVTPQSVETAKRQQAYRTRQSFIGIGSATRRPGARGSLAPARSGSGTFKRRVCAVVALDVHSQLDSCCEAFRTVTADSLWWRSAYGRINSSKRLF